MNKAFFKTRYDALHQAGVHKLMAGDVAIFGGVTEAMKQDLVVALRTQSGVGTMYLLDELANLESLGFAFFLANREFPLHVTVQVSTGGFEAETALVEDSGLLTLLSFDRLVLDSGGNIVLMNESVPRELAEWRGWVSQVMMEFGGQPKQLPILHSSLGRIMSPKSPTPDAAAQLQVWVEDWNSRLQVTPVQLVSSHTYVGTVYDLLTM